MLRAKADVKLSDSDWSLNGPNSDLSYSTFVVPNLRGFSGNSNGFIPSVANLSKWAGKKVYFKFRFGTYDNLVSTQPGRLGWTLDNLEIINPIYYNTTACVTSGLGDNICLASKGKGTLIESNKIVSVTPKDKEIKFNVFPNPAKAIAYVNLFNGEQFEVMNIVDATGKNIYSTVLNQSNQQQIKINTSQFSKGIYFVEIKGKQEMAKKKLVSAMVSITSFNEDLRRIMEPRTTTANQKLKVINELSNAGVRMGIMMGPMIPGLNEHEMQRIMKAAADNGATFTAYTFIRLNGAIKFLFHDWLYKNFPDRADKVWHLIEQSHDGKVNDTRWGVRMRGEGNIAEMVAQQYKKYGKLYNMNAEEWSLDTSKFQVPGGQGKLF